MTRYTIMAYALGVFLSAGVFQAHTANAGKMFSSWGSAPWIKSMERELGKRTGRNSCGKFVQKHVPGNWSALAIENRNRGKASKCKPGAVAVMHGHVGVIHKAGCSGGRCSVISGNGRNGRADIKSYPRSRIVACRWPG